MRGAWIETTTTVEKYLQIIAALPCGARGLKQFDLVDRH